MNFDSFFSYCIWWHVWHREQARRLGEFEQSFDAERAPPDDIDDTQHVTPRGWVT